MSRTFIKQTHSKEVDKRTGNSPTADESAYTIPNGKVLFIDSFAFGHENTFQEARIELVLRDGSDTLLQFGYAAGTTVVVPMSEEITGDGSKQVVMRLINGDAGNLHMSGSWRGHLRDV